jgi:hypothetical protein
MVRPPIAFHHGGWDPVHGAHDRNTIATRFGVDLAGWHAE